METLSAKHSDPTIFMTAEVRWFFEGSIPTHVQHWFEKLAAEDPPKERTDHYLVYPNTTTCGIKFREETLEVKAFVKKLNGITLVPSLKGNIELWEKVSLDNVNFSDTGVEHEINYRAVKKKRWRCLWQWSFDNLYRASPDKTVMAGCQFELTSIHIQERSFWSLSFESFSNMDNAVMILENTVSFVRQLPALMQLEEQQLFKNAREASYPEFLHRLLQSQEKVVQKNTI